MSIEAGDTVRVLTDDGDPTMLGQAMEPEGEDGGAWLVETYELGVIVVPERDLRKEVV